MFYHFYPNLLKTNLDLISYNISKKMIQIYKNLMQYKDLLMILTWKEISIRYRQTVIGIAWAIIQPLSFMLVFAFIFTYLMPTKVSGYPKMMFFYAALVPWTFFSTAINYAIPCLVNQFNLITKIYFPREILPISMIIVAFVDFMLAGILFIIFMFLYHINLTWQILWFFPLLIQLILFTTAMSLMLSSLNVFYRDVNVASGFIMRLWFFITPIFYSIDSLSIKLKLLLFINPLTFIIENMRRCLIEGRGVIAWQFSIVSIILLIYFYISVMYFNRIERKFADVI